MIISVISIAMIGLVISAYGYFVESRIQADPTYKPACDISDIVSCSKPIRSKYGKLFLFSNTSLGFGYYTSMISLAAIDYAYLSFFLAIGGICASAIFAYILFFKIRAFCLICMSVYAVNVALLIATFMSL